MEDKLARRTIPTKSRKAAARASSRSSAAVKGAGSVTAAPTADDIARMLTGAARVASRGARIAGVGARPLRAPSTNLTAELNNIDFRKMIGGPLQAAVDAQVASSLATVDFINKVGFTAPDSGGKRELVMVDFTHTRKEAGETTGKEIKISVPLLAMLPIPSLRIEHVIIDFNVKLNSVESSTTSDTLGVNAEVKGGWGPVSFKVSASYQRKTATNIEVKKEYALNVNVKAVQDEIPAGLEKILNLLAA
jgi:Protein of unknown function (DUF2589)